jgi:ammonium transporter, Amt family
MCPWLSGGLDCARSNSSQIGEFAYDYVEVRRDYLAWTPAKNEPLAEEHTISGGDRHGIPEHSEMLNQPTRTEGLTPAGSDGRPDIDEKAENKQD